MAPKEQNSQVIGQRIRGTDIVFYCSVFLYAFLYAFHMQRRICCGRKYDSNHKQSIG